MLLSGAYSQNPNLHIYLAFGQSNMEGQGSIESPDRMVENGFKTFQALDCSNLGRTKDTWYTAEPPTCNCWSGLSPVDYFGRTMLEAAPEGVEIGVINVAVAGCDIRLFDKNIYQGYDSTSTESWFLDRVKAYEGNPYQYLIGRAKVAQQDGVIKGILLHQGETNTGDTQWPQYVKKIYNDLMADLSLNPDSVPILAGEVVHADQQGCCSSMNSIIANLPSVISNAHVISSQGCTVQSDNTHFDSEGYRELGRRYAEKMLALIDYSVSLPLMSAETNGYFLQRNEPGSLSQTSGITFGIPGKTHVSLKVFNSHGDVVTELAGREFISGRHTIGLGTLELAPGSYYYTLRADGFFTTHQWILLP